jgi:hypothetical protein
MGDEELFFFNGVDATTGSYLLPPLPVDAVSKLARGERIEAAHLDELRYRHARATETTFGPAEGVDPRDLSDAGWGVILAAGAEEGILEALRPLLEHRRQQATQRHERRFRRFTGEHAYRAGESKQEFLARNGAGPGPADPDRMPYYLLLVGDPEAIPYTFQYQLDVQYAVGRICFDTLDEYARYAAAVVTAESTPSSNTTTAAFFAPSNPHDPATALSASELVTPLADRLAADHPDWTVQRLVGDAADKPALVDLLGGDTTPSLLFTASHGAGFPPDHPTQRRRQGALICQEWGGPDAGISEDAYVSGEDIGNDASLRGLVAFHFACFGAGTPAWDDFGHRDGGPRRPLASRPFVAALPQRLLGHERGGALAIAGHVDRAWGYSFVWPGAGRQTEVFRSSVERLLTGHPIGSAFEYLNERYAELASDLSVALEDISYGKRPDHRALATMWTANNDARGFMVLGDPAVRMPVVATPPTHERETVAVAAAATTQIPPPPPRPTVREAGVPASERPTEPPPRPDPGSPAPRPAGEDIGRDDPREPVTASVPDLELDYGLREGLRQTGDRLAVAVQHLAETLAAAMERAAESVAVVEVATYTSDDPSQAVYDRATKRFDGARLRALSRASVSGDLQLLVDEDDLLDERLWACHLAMVEQAQRTRTELFRSAGTVVTGMWDALRPGG